MSRARKTIRQQLNYRPEIAGWFDETKTLFNQVVAFYFEVIEDHRGRVNADTVVDRGQQFARMHGILDRSRGRLVGLAVDQAALDARAGDDARVAVGPVIAAVVGVGVARGADAALRAAAEGYWHLPPRLWEALRSLVPLPLPRR